MKERNVLIVGRDPDQNEGVKALFEQQGANVTAVATLEEALERDLEYDVAFISLSADGLRRLDIADELQKRNPNAKHLLITSLGSPQMIASVPMPTLGGREVAVEGGENLLSSCGEEEHEVRSPQTQVIAQQLNQRLAEKIEELSTLYSISEAFNGIEAEDDLFKFLTKLAKTVTHADSAVFYMADLRSNRMIFKAAHNVGAPPCVNEEIEVNPTILRTILSCPSPLTLASSKPVKFCQFQSELCRFKTMIGAPLYVRDELFGIIVARRAESEAFDQKERSYLAALLKKAALAIENSALYEGLYLNLLNALNSLVATLEAKDPYTQRHSLRVTRYSLLIAEALDCPPRELEAIKLATILHDIGKIGVSDAVLQKPRKLLPAEFEQIKSHPLIGEKILEPLGFSPEERAIIRNHHERWDGGGYPDGFKGREIPFLARIVSLADAFDAMTSDRPYRRAMKPQQAIKEIIKNSDKQFDGRIVRALLDLYLDNRLEGAPHAERDEPWTAV